MTTPDNPSGFSYDIYGGIDDEIDAARAQSLVNNGSPESGDALSNVASSMFSYERAHTELIKNLDPNFLSVAETSRYATSEVLAPLDLYTPSLAEFAKAGIDFQRLSAGYNGLIRGMVGVNYEPALVFAPVLSADQWQETYQTLQDNPRVNRDGHIKDGGLFIDDYVKDGWDKFNLNEHTVRIDDQDWQVAGVPASTEPQLSNLDHNGNDRSGDLHPDLQLLLETKPLDANCLNPTIASYLTLQATKLHTLVMPIDNGERWTWLQGEFGNPDRPFGLLGLWNPNFGQARVRWDWADIYDKALGMRPTIWG